MIVRYSGSPTTLAAQSRISPTLQPAPSARPLLSASPLPTTRHRFTRTIADMQRVSDAMLAAFGASGGRGSQQPPPPLTRILIGADAFALADAPTGAAVKVGPTFAACTVRMCV